MTRQDNDPFTDMDRLVGQLAAELSRLSITDRTHAVLCACSTSAEIKAIAALMVDMADWTKTANKDEGKRVCEIIPRIACTQLSKKRQRVIDQMLTTANHKVGGTRQ